ncbi:hypothetical protein TBLA_0D03250 [Henningerozyma blattae CBS 6284]|uniref:Transcription initiation factor TFIID subunit 8 n=1 Tax=Henningerozyma blattae (strain ATCC 34711 / CBS 6284 / DSM 70876 / NBRC 10599 / NRRL Y-10934 / UCD 77-7) TaxID=1071380 RepID=I2H373_HENB6|nr:hypothetical protein TBLA_0D03250 [Tetrapisispora blattae CBS 6284]CCH60825.1 hypothetical protein TBLA_0D03250 [Tetrapisispora blattae CBS 6284]
MHSSSASIKKESNTSKLPIPDHKINQNVLKNSHPTSSNTQLLKNLPDLIQSPNRLESSCIGQLLAKSIALQLKPMNDNTSISTVAFNRLLTLVDLQLNDMIYQLARLSITQRRLTIASNDLSLWLRSFNLNPSDLTLYLEESNFIKSKFNKDYNLLYELLRDYNTETNHNFKNPNYSTSDLLNNKSSESSSSRIVPPSNTILRSMPEWLPSLPPDHTYKFTPLYNEPITDETVMKKILVNEGKLAESALIKLLEASTTSEINSLPTPETDRENDLEQNINIDTNTNGNSMTLKSVSENEKTNTNERLNDELLAQDETKAIYGSALQVRKIKKRFELMIDPKAETQLSEEFVYPSTFNVEEYARKQVQKIREQVLFYEEKQLQAQKNPFWKYSKMIVGPSQFHHGPHHHHHHHHHHHRRYSNSSTSSVSSSPSPGLFGGVSKKQINHDIQQMFNRSLNNLINSLPNLAKEKASAREIAENEREKKVQEMLKKKQKELNEKQSSAGALDLHDLQKENDGLFADLGSSDDDESSTRHQNTSDKTQETHSPKLSQNEDQHANNNETQEIVKHVLEHNHNNETQEIVNHEIKENHKNGTQDIAINETEQDHNNSAQEIENSETGINAAITSTSTLPGSIASPPTISEQRAPHTSAVLTTNDDVTEGTSKDDSSQVEIKPSEGVASPEN